MPIKKPIQNAMQIVPQITFQFIGFSLTTERVTIYISGWFPVIQQQQTMMFSKYMDLYDIVVPQDNMLRRINDLIGFSFIFDELQSKYCHDNGRNAFTRNVSKSKKRAALPFS
jgi:hypothetical protein